MNEINFNDLKTIGYSISVEDYVKMNNASKC